MALRDNYLESYDKVTGEMLDQASAVLTGIRKDMDKDEINSALLELFRIIPRKMQSVSDYLLHDEALLDEILLREWDLLRVMEARAAACGEETLPGQTVLEHMGLDIRGVSPGELRTIKILLTRESACRLEYAYCVRNKHTDKRFYAWMDKNGYSEHDIHYLFHGSCGKTKGLPHGGHEEKSEIR